MIATCARCHRLFDKDRMVCADCAALPRKETPMQTVDMTTAEYRNYVQMRERGLSPVASDPLLASAVADALRDLIEEYEDRKAQFGDYYLWQKHENADTLPTAKNVLKQWDTANAEHHARPEAKRKDVA